MKSSIVSAIKSKLVSNKSRVRRVLFGLFKGLRFDINLRSQTQLYLGLWERETYGAIRRAAQTAEWLIDVGAGQGELCILFAGLPHVRRIIAIEPNGLETTALRANLKYNNIDPDRVEVFTQCAGTKKDADYIEIDRLGISHSTHGLIKIDVDGFEFDVLQSGKKLFSEGNVAVMVETHSLELEQICIEWLKGYGYACNIIKNAWWRSLIPERRPILHNRWFFAEHGCNREQHACHSVVSGD